MDISPAAWAIRVRLVGVVTAIAVSRLAANALAAPARQYPRSCPACSLPTKAGPSVLSLSPAPWSRAGLPADGCAECRGTRREKVPRTRSGMNIGNLQPTAGEGARNELEIGGARGHLRSVR
jgi:hypothetical protein